ncbi:hypothetical protein KFK09_023694 [Dendrobium nobile]|uniref:BHLH domain-containing protein n=1 Tax=Dendrobium nobile TaxID=94219 RepID=A0A8T3AH69_DENNO|nr:hypothetical protein KFK09_023694 [Dendrobium nobile]
MMESDELDIDYYSRIMEEAAFIDIYLNEPQSAVGTDASSPETIAQNGNRKRERDESCVGQCSKAIREKMRRDKMNERFLELSKLLEAGRPAKSDKFAILDDTIRILNELRAEALELKKKNKKLEEEIATLKEEKNELKEEKSLLKAEKERMEGYFRTMPLFAAGYMPPHPVAYHPVANKMMTFPNYGAIPMWQFLPPSARDVSKDHELRPPMA